MGDRPLSLLSVGVEAIYLWSSWIRSADLSNKKKKNQKREELDKDTFSVDVFRQRFVIAWPDLFGMRGLAPRDEDTSSAASHRCFYTQFRPYSNSTSDTHHFVFPQKHSGLSTLITQAFNHHSFTGPTKEAYFYITATAEESRLILVKERRAGPSMLASLPWTGSLRSPPMSGANWHVNFTL